MKTLLLSVAALGLCAGIALAQVAPPGAPAADPAAPAVGVAPPPAGSAAPLPMPCAGPAPMPGGPRGPGVDRRGPPPPPPPPPSRAAHFRLEGPGTVLDVQCAEDEPMQACADIAVRLLDHAPAVPVPVPADPANP